MAVKEILQMGNPILWEKSAEITDISLAEVKRVIADLDDTLADFRKRNGFGRGIAAPQIGELARIIFVRMADDSFVGPLINPRITKYSDDKIEMWDGCFSFPNLLVRVSRARTIQVEYTDRDGTGKKIEAEGDLSELLQHEIDHLDGILAVQKALTPKAFMTREEWDRQNIK